MQNLWYTMHKHQAAGAGAYLSCFDPLTCMFSWPGREPSIKPREEVVRLGLTYQAKQWRPPETESVWKMHVWILNTVPKVENVRRSSKTKNKTVLKALKQINECREHMTRCVNINIVPQIHGYSAPSEQHLMTGLASKQDFYLFFWSKVS